MSGRLLLTIAMLKDRLLGPGLAQQGNRIDSIEYGAVRYSFGVEFAGWVAF